MKKIFNTYAIVWAIALITFNAITFVSVAATCGFKALLPSFWIGYAFITVTLLVNLAISSVLMKPEKANKSFMNLSVGYIAFIALIGSTVVGAVTMAVATIPWWIGFIINMVLFAFYAIAIISGSTAANIVDDVENKVKGQTLFIKMLTTDAQTLIAKAGAETKESANKVYEAIRYSDPMSIEALAGVESQITIKFNEYSNAVVDNDVDLTKALEKELLILINDRNNKCKVMK